MFDTLRQDFARYHEARRPLGRVRSVVYACCAYGFLAVLVHRYGRWTHRVRPPVLGFALRLLYRVLKIPTELLLGIDVSIHSDIGPGLYIGHFGGIFLHCNAGAGLTVGQGVTIGYKGAGMSDRWPQLGDDVYVGAGAKVIGDIQVGDRVIVGANTVVTKDVADDMRVVGAAVRTTSIAAAAARPAHRAERRSAERRAPSTGDTASANGRRGARIHDAARSDSSSDGSGAPGAPRPIGDTDTTGDHARHRSTST